MSNIKSALKIRDLVYIRGKMFTTFFPDSEKGKAVFQELVEQNSGSNKVFNFHSKNVIRQLRSAGYIVKKEPMPTETLEDIFKEMDELGI